MIDRSGRRLQNTFVAFVFIIFFNYHVDTCTSRTCISTCNMYKNQCQPYSQIASKCFSPRFFFASRTGGFSFTTTEVWPCVLFGSGLGAQQKDQKLDAQLDVFFFFCEGFLLFMFFFQTDWRSCFLVFLEGVNNEIHLGIVGFWWIVTVGWLGVNSLESP